MTTRANSNVTAISPDDNKSSSGLLFFDITLRSASSICSQFAFSIEVTHQQRTMINVLDTRRRLPATEALREMERCQLPRQCRQRRATPSPPSKNSSEERYFDMTELWGVTQPLEDVDAFPTIEWVLDDDPPVPQDAPHRLPPPADDDDPMQSSYHSHSSHSTPTLGKRSRRSYQSRLVRSKSLNSSLCYLAEQSTRPHRGRIAHPKEGSWGQFVCHSDENSTHQSSKTDHQMDLFLSPLMVLCSNDHQNGLE